MNVKNTSDKTPLDEAKAKEIKINMAVAKYLKSQGAKSGQEIP
jgi:hypothetical protein